MAQRKSRLTVRSVHAALKRAGIADGYHLVAHRDAESYAIVWIGLHVRMDECLVDECVRVLAAEGFTAAAKQSSVLRMRFVAITGAAQ